MLDNLAVAYDRLSSDMVYQNFHILLSNSLSNCLAGAPDPF